MPKPASTIANFQSVRHWCKGSKGISIIVQGCKICCGALLHFTPTCDVILLIQLPQSQEDRAKWAKNSPWLAMTHPRPMWINISQGPGSAAGSPQRRLNYERMDTNGWRWWSDWGISRPIKQRTIKRDKSSDWFWMPQAAGMCPAPWMMITQQYWVRNSVFATLEIKPATELAAPQLERRWFTPEMSDALIRANIHWHTYIIYI